jgi:hypothetical protein
METNMAKQKKMDSYCVADAVSMALSGIEELRDELQEWYDGMPESLQGGEKGQALETCIEALSNYEQVDVPECVSESQEDGDETTKGNVGGVRFEMIDMNKKRMSRAQRRDLNVSLLQCVVDAVRQELEEHEDSGEDRYAETRDDLNAFLDELENAICEFEGAEFPGMYG